MGNEELGKNLQDSVIEIYRGSCVVTEFVPWELNECP
jgi:hypothetical protein